MDCGEGVQRQIRESSIGLGKEVTILITHLHGDHVSGLLGLLQTMSLAQRKKPLTMVAPAKLMKWLEITSGLLNIGLTFPILFTPARPGVVVSNPRFRVRASKASHSVEAFSYVVEEKPRPGVFYPEKARALKVPEGRLWSRLQKGRSVRVGKTVVRPAQVTGPPRPGRKVGYSGDTRATARLARFFAGCDLLIFDSTFSGRDLDRAVKRKHSTCEEAAELAKQAGVRRLALTHFSARYTTAAPLVREAKKIFPKTFAASDGMSVDVGYPDA